MAQVGRFLVSHRMFLSGEPRSYSPLLAKHFLLNESLLLPGCAALVLSHYCASMSMHPDRKEHFTFALQEVGARYEAILFWSGDVSRNRMDTTSVVARGMSLVLQALTMPVWMIVAAISPAHVHRCLEAANDVMYDKYKVVYHGAPRTFFDMQIDRMAKAKQLHHSGGELSTDIPAAIFIIFFVLFHYR